MAKRGRPVLDSDNYCIVRSYSVRKELYEQLIKLLEGSNTTISSIITTSFETYLADNEQNKKI